MALNESRGYENDPHGNNCPMCTPGDNTRKKPLKIIKIDNIEKGIKLHVKIKCSDCGFEYVGVVFPTDLLDNDVLFPTPPLKR